MRPPGTSALARWRFDEQHDSVTPTDETGTLADLEPGSALARPAVVKVSDGFGRRFTADPATGLEAGDAADALDTSGNVSVLAILAFDADAQNAATPSDGDLVARMIPDASEIGLQLTLAIDGAPAADNVRLILSWLAEGSGFINDTGVVISWAPGEEKVIAAIRERDGDAIRVRYVVDGEVLEGDDDHPTTVSEITGASVYVGAVPDGLGGYTNHLCADVIFLEIRGEAIAPEEVEQLWLARTVDGPRSAKALKRLLPPGAFSEDPESFVQRELDVEAAGLAGVRNTARLRRDYLMPARAFGAHLEQWEALSGRSPAPHDTVDDRRERVEEYFQLAPGYNTADLKYQLAEILGYEDPEDIDVLKYTVDRTDINGLTEDGNGTALGTHVEATAADIRFLGITVASTPHHLMSFTASRDLLFGGVVTRNSGTDVLGGYMIGSRASNEWLFVGLLNDGIGFVVVSARFAGGEMDGAFTTLDAAGPSDAAAFRFRHKGGGLYDVQWGANDAAAQAQAPTEIEGPEDPLWAGPVLLAVGANDSASGNYDLSGWYSHEVEGTAPVTYHVFRDPADGGQYDVEGAHRLLQEIGPLHFEGFVIDQTQLTCDDTDTGCDRQPMGV
jgi:hypothetical protein